MSRVATALDALCAAEGELSRALDLEFPAGTRVEWTERSGRRLRGWAIGRDGVKLRVQSEMTGGEVVLHPGRLILP